MELLKAAKKSEAKRIQQSGTQEDARIAELRKKLHFVENEYKVFVNFDFFLSV